MYDGRKHIRLGALEIELFWEKKFVSRCLCAKAGKHRRCAWGSLRDCYKCFQVPGVRWSGV